MSAYNLLKFGHILLAIIAVGLNASYGIWIARATREPEHLPHVLRGIKLLDDRLANPAYGLLLVTGLSMVWVGDIDLTQFWLVTALVLYGALVLLGLLGYTPTLRNQIRELERSGPASASYRRLAGRGTAMGAVLGVLVVAIVFLMVIKPAP
jgi:uncharacterized membrane protein